MIATAVSAQGVVDVHSHIITPEFLQDLERHDALLDEGFPIPDYQLDNHLAWMDNAGVSTSVLTLAAPQPFNNQVVRLTNERCAEIRQQHPGRFKFCATLPLPDVDAAIAEAVYVLDTLKADGIKLATNVRGQYLGDPALDPLMQVLNDRKAVVIIHPHRPEPINGSVMSQTPLAMQEYLSETTRAVANMISRNVLARYPNVKIVVPHCGAYLPLAVPRMKSLHPVMKANGLVGDIDWAANLASLYYDLAGSHSPEIIKMMLTITTPDHLLYGSDFPYVKPDVLTAQLQRMKAYLAQDPELAPFERMFLADNARYLFGERQVAPQPEATADDELIVRIAEIEVYEQYLDEYLQAAASIGTTSVKTEPGVVCIFPTQLEGKHNHFRIVEIYRNQAAYQSHLATDHFKHYKESTLHMVKTLNLVDVNPLDIDAMKLIFKKK